MLQLRLRGVTRFFICLAPILRRGPCSSPKDSGSSLNCQLKEPTLPVTKSESDHFTEISRLLQQAARTTPTRARSTRHSCHE